MNSKKQMKVLLCFAEQYYKFTLSVSQQDQQKMQLWGKKIVVWGKK